jgi:hypothetical protein
MATGTHKEEIIISLGEMESEHHVAAVVGERKDAKRMIGLRGDK